MGSFDDCECENGYFKQHDKCVREHDRCTNSFQCPAHSYRKHNRKCYDSFDDCECEKDTSSSTTSACANMTNARTISSAPPTATGSTTASATTLSTTASARRDTSSSAADACTRTFTLAPT